MIRRQVIMPVSPERLWEALTDPDEMAGWFGAQVDWTLEEGAPAHFVGDDGSERTGRVFSVRPGRHLRFQWWPARQTTNPEGSELPEVTEVSYLLEPVPEGTRLTIQERQVGAPAGFGAAQASAVGSVGSPARWTTWDSRLAQAWARVGGPVREGVRA